MHSFAAFCAGERFPVSSETAVMACYSRQIGSLIAGNTRIRSINGPHLEQVRHSSGAFRAAQVCRPAGGVSLHHVRSTFLKEVWLAAHGVRDEGVVAGEMPFPSNVLPLQLFLLTERLPGRTAFLKANLRARWAGVSGLEGLT